MPQRPVRDVIAKQRPLVLTAKTTVAEAARRMKRQNKGAVLIVDHDKLVGIFTEHDALHRVLAEGRDPNTTALADVMTTDPRTIEPTRPFGHALLMMHEGGYRHLPVVSRGKPIGVVSARDALAPELYEVESEIERREQIAEHLG
jgi:CBS domain-containing protein